MMNLININVNKFDRVVYCKCFDINYKNFNDEHNILINNRSIIRYLTFIIIN